MADLASAAYSAGFLGEEAKHTNWAQALGNTLGAASRTVGDVDRLLNAITTQEDQRGFDAIELALEGAPGNDGTKAPGAMEDTYYKYSNNIDGLEQGFQDTWDSIVNEDWLVQNANLSRTAASRIVDKANSDLKYQYDLRTQAITQRARQNQVDSNASAKQILVTKMDISPEEAWRIINEDWNALGGAADPSLNPNNPDRAVALVDSYMQSWGKRQVENLVSTSDKTIGEIVDEISGEYDSVIGKLPVELTDAARLSAATNKDALREMLETYSTQEAGNLARDAEAKGVRFNNNIRDYVDSGRELTNETFAEIAGECFDQDQAKFRDAKIAQYGYDIDLSGKYKVVDDLMASPTLLADLETYRSVDPSTVNINVFDNDVDEVMGEINSPSETISLSTRYGDYIQEKAAECRLTSEETEYFSRSLNQYANTASEWASDQWKKYIETLRADPRVTTTAYREAVENLRAAGVIDVTTYDDLIGKKDSPYQKDIDRAIDRIKILVTQNTEFNKDKNYTGSDRWNELVYRTDFNNNIERLVTDVMSSGGNLDQAVDDYARNMIRVMQDDDLSDIVYNSGNRILEDVVNYNPNDGFSIGNKTLFELNQEFINNQHSGTYNVDAIASGTQYLQGSPSTRTWDGLVDSVVKQMYGNSASYDTLTPTEQEFAKANAAVSLAQYSQYYKAARDFGGRRSFSSVFVDGYGIAAMDDQGFVYMPQQDGSYTMLYARDPAYRRQLLSNSGTNKFINPADTQRVSMGFYRLRYEDRTPKPSEVPEGRTAEDMQNPWIDQVYGINTQPVDETSTPVESKGISRFVNPQNDKIFAGLKTSLMTAGGPVNAQ